MQSCLLKWMGLFMQRGTAQKPALAYCSACPSKLQTYTRCLQNTAGTTHNTITVQFLSITTALPFCAVFVPGQDPLFCVPACCHFAGRSVACKKLTGTQQESLPLAESRDWPTVRHKEQELAEPSCSSLPVHFYGSRGTHSSMRKSGARFWISIFLKAVPFSKCFVVKRNM